MFVYISKVKSHSMDQLLSSVLGAKFDPARQRDPGQMISKVDHMTRWTRLLEPFRS